MHTTLCAKKPSHHSFQGKSLYQILAEIAVIPPVFSP